jgi:ABC-type uncharacterized transport system ATPase subunit
LAQLIQRLSDVCKDHPAEDTVPARVPDNPRLSVRNLSHRFGDPAAPVVAISDISFDVSAGRFISIIGQSGSRDDHDRRDMIQTLAAEFEIYEQVEDAIFYPGVRPVSEDVPVAHAEHQQLADMTRAHPPGRHRHARVRAAPVDIAPGGRPSCARPRRP